MPRVPQGRVIFAGTVSGGTETWQTSFAMDPLASRTDLELTNMVNAIATLWTVEVWGGAGVLDRVSNRTAYSKTRLEDVREPGGVVRVAESVEAVPIVGMSVQAQLPPEVAEVVSLRTGLPGPRRRGRMYFPPLANDQIELDGSMLVAARVDLANTFASFFQAFNASPVVAGTAFVASDAGQHLTAINAVQVGSVFDAQRRRRNQLNEIYTTVAV